MKRKALLFALLLAFFAPWAANAQETLTVYGDGTQTTNAYVPMYGGYFDDYTKSEFVIPAEKLENMTGGTITSMKFYISSVSTYGSGWDNTHQVVFLKEVESATLSAWSGMDGATTVFDGMFTVPASTDTEFEIEFTENTYEYQGGNLLVGIYNTDDGSYRTVNWYGETVTGASGGASNGSSLDNITFSQKNFIPKTTFTYEPASGGCPKPTTLVASNVTAHTVVLTWEGEASEYGFNLEYKKASEVEWTRIGLGNTTFNYTLNGNHALDPETVYNARVQAVCDLEDDNNNSGWRETSFTTDVACPAPTGLAVAEASITANEATATWTGTSQSYVVMIGEVEISMGTLDFEDQVIPAYFTNDATRPWKIEPSGYNNSSYCIVPGNKGVNSSDSDLTYEVAGPCTVSFMAKVSSESGWDYGRFLIDGTQQMEISGTQDWTEYSYEVAEGTHTLVWRYHKDGSGASGNDLFYVDNITMPVASVSSWSEYPTNNQSYPFDNLTSNTSYQVKVKGNCGTEGYSTETEPVSFTTLVSCPAPENLHTVEGSITAHGVNIVWDAEEGDWFEYLLTTEVNINPEDVVYNTLTQDHDELWNSGLLADTDYKFFLRKKCSDTDFSEVVTLTFHTLVACPAPTNFEVDEESITGHTATLEWNGTSESYTVYYRTKAYVDGIEEGFTDAPSGWIFRTGALNADGTATLSGSSSWNSGYSNGVFDTHIYMNLYSTKNYWLITPSMDINNGDALSFDMAYTAYSGTQATPAPNCTTHRFAVLISTDDMATWTILREWNNNGSEDVLDNVSQTGENVSISLASYAGQTAYIAFFGHSETSSYDNNFHLDNVAIGLPVAAGEWLTAEPEDDATSVELTGLTVETTYEAKVQGDCGEEGLSAETEPITFTTGIACEAPLNFEYYDLKSNRVSLYWPSDAHVWQLCLNGNEEDLINIEEEDVYIDEDSWVFYTLTGLTEQTPYTVKLRANCGEEDGVSAWTDNLSFTTMEACPTPTNVQIGILGQYNAEVYWEGDSEDFTVKYREAAGIQPILSEGFENGIGNWTMRNCSTSTGVSNSNNSYVYSGNAAFVFVYNSNPPQYLISPELTGVTSGMKLEFYYKNTSTTYAPETFQIGFSSTDDETASFDFGEEYEASDTEWHLFSETIPAGTKYICWQLNSYDKMRLCIDDIVVGVEVPAGEWQTISVSAGYTNCGLSDLNPNTKYEVVVVPSCNEENASEPVFFTTHPIKHFVTEGEWNVGNNWEPAGLPGTNGDGTPEDVIIDAAATIPANYVANVGHITLGTNGAITIADGGQLRHTNADTDGVTVTLEKVINGYDDMNVKSGYYFISPAPFTQTISPNSVENLKSNEYDLYSFYAGASDGLEWRNLHDSNTSLKSAHGYLYANSETVTLKSTGPAISITGGAGLSIQYNPNAGYDFNGWELAGNPYVCNGYVYIKDVNNEIVETDFYRMNEDGDGYDLISSTEPLKPFEGVFVQLAGEQGQYSISFSPDPIESDNNAKLNMNLSHNGNRIDMARVRFGEGQNLGKMSFRENSSKVYFPMEGKDYAMVYSEGMGEMPVNFKAENNGNYTLSFNAEEVSFAYLHLIDNMTGIDTDLLSTPSYSFEAKTTDYANRFKLVFATGNNNSSEDSFAFFSNGSFVINNEGNATVQVIDINGRIMSSKSINGCANINVNAAAGVYMIRLINGENVKVQKVVVR